MNSIKHDQSGLHGSRIGHLVSLKNLGGIERTFSRFYTHYAREYDHHILKQTDQIHSLLIPGLEPFESSRIHSIKKVAGLKIPRAAHRLRGFYQEYLLKRLEIKAILVWGKLMNHPLVFPDSISLVHYEHGSAWLANEHLSLRKYLARLDGVICNSNAALRFLQIRWGVSKELPSRVIYNTVKLPERKAAHLPGRFRLGFAGRLIALKAPMVALETFAELKKSCPYAELWIAGIGPQEAVLRTYAKRWGLSDSVKFFGLVDDMSAFYSELDAFICPSWREPFGNVAQEALSYGVPTLVGSVDGLAEQVTQGENGAVLLPRRSRMELARYGKECIQGPDEVYSPEEDTIVQAGILEPMEAASILATWAESPRLRKEMGNRARDRVAREFDFYTYGHTLANFMESVISHRSNDIN